MSLNKFKIIKKVPTVKEKPAIYPSLARNCHTKLGLDYKVDQRNLKQITGPFLKPENSSEYLSFRRMYP